MRDKCLVLFAMHTLGKCPIGTAGKALTALQLTQHQGGPNDYRQL